MKRIEMPKLDVTKYIGTKTMIVSAKIEESVYGKMLRLKTAPIELKDGDTLPDGIHLYASAILGLQEDEDGSLAVGIDSKADKWLKEHKIDVTALPDTMTDAEIPAFHGKEVIVQKSKTGYLEIA